MVGAVAAPVLTGVEAVHAGVLQHRRKNAAIALDEGQPGWGPGIDTIHLFRRGLREMGGESGLSYFEAQQMVSARIAYRVACSQIFVTWEDRQQLTKHVFKMSGDVGVAMPREARSKGLTEEMIGRRTEFPKVPGGSFKEIFTRQNLLRTGPYLASGVAAVCHNAEMNAAQAPQEPEILSKEPGGEQTRREILTDFARLFAVGSLLFTGAGAGISAFQGDRQLGKYRGIPTALLDSVIIGRGQEEWKQFLNQQVRYPVLVAAADDPLSSEDWQGAYDRYAEIPTESGAPEGFLDGCTYESYLERCRQVALGTTAINDSIQWRYAGVIDSLPVIHEGTMPQGWGDVLAADVINPLSLPDMRYRVAFRPDDPDNAAYFSTYQQFLQQ